MQYVKAATILITRRKTPPRPVRIKLFSLQGLRQVGLTWRGAGGPAFPVRTRVKAEQTGETRVLAWRVGLEVPAGCVPLLSKVSVPKNLLERHSCQGIKLVQCCWRSSQSRTEMAEGERSFALTWVTFVAGEKCKCFFFHAYVVFHLQGSVVQLELWPASYWSLTDRMLNCVQTCCFNTLAVISRCHWENTALASGTNCILIYLL